MKNHKWNQKILFKSEEDEKNKGSENSLKRTEKILKGDIKVKLQIDR